MWGLWFFPLVVLSFLVGLTLGIVWFLVSRKDRRPKIFTVIAVPVGCAVMPIFGLILLAGVGAFFQSSDTQLFEEIFGYRTSITEDRMLFDDFGHGSDREIFMRAEPTEAERRKLLTIPRSVVSDLTLNKFAARGTVHGFYWWMSANSFDFEYCKSARIRDAHGYKGWTEFRIAECLDAGSEFPAKANVGEIYVIASRRAQ